MRSAILLVMTGIFAPAAVALDDAHRTIDLTKMDTKYFFHGRPPTDKMSKEIIYHAGSDSKDPLDLIQPYISVDWPTLLVAAEQSKKKSGIGKTTYPDPWEAAAVLVSRDATDQYGGKWTIFITVASEPGIVGGYRYSVQPRFNCYEIGSGDGDMSQQDRCVHIKVLPTKVALDRMSADFDQH